jgi:rhamnosyltransferase
VTPDVSIVVPTRNGIATLPALLDALAAQRDAAAREVVIVDSGSTDGTIEYARRRADHVIAIEPAQFNHGTTRNLGISHTRGRFVVLTVQDARPLDDMWLTHLLAPMREDDGIAGTFARQVPAGSASAVVRDQLARWVAHQPVGRVVALDAAAFDALAPHERLRQCAFDNVCAAIRTSVWQRHPFPATPIAEDLEWSRDVLLTGHRIAYVPEAVVEHSHERSARYELARTWVLHQQLLRLFGLRAIPSPLGLLPSIGATIAAHRRLVRDAGVAPGSAEWRRAMALAVAWPLGQFLGGWTAARGRDQWRPRGL